MLSTFKCTERAVLLKEISTTLRKVSREIKVLQASEMKPKDKMKKLDEFYSQVDELDLGMFDSTLLATNSPKAITTTKSKSTSSKDNSDINSESDLLETDNKNLMKTINSILYPTTSDKSRKLAKG